MGGQTGCTGARAAAAAAAEAAAVEEEEEEEEEEPLSTAGDVDSRLRY